MVQRQPVKEPLETGIKAIDAMTNIGRGQRELIIGDQKTGKSAVCLDTIINQRQHWGTDKQVKCIYVAIGQKATTVREFVGALEENGPWSTPWSSAPRPTCPPPSSTSPPTPARPWASTGCTRASTP